MRMILQRLRRRKSRLYWFTMVFLVSLALVGKVCFSYVPLLVKEILHRVPYINTNVEVIVEIDKNHLPARDSFRVGTPVYRFQPELSLVGFVAKVERSDMRFWRFYLGVGQKYAVAVLRDDTLFEFLHTSPSLLAILGQFFSKDRGRQLKKQMMSLATRNQDKITSVFSRLGKILGRELKDQKLADKVLTDHRLRREIMDTLRQEILLRVDWDSALNSIERNKNTARLTAILKDNIDWKKVVARAAESGAHHALDETSSYLVDPKYFSRTRGSMVIKVFTSIAGFIFDRKNSIDRAMRGFQRGAWQGGWGVSRRELRRVFKEHHHEIVTHGSQSLRQAAKDVKLAERVVKGLQMLAKNKNLLEHVKSRFGDKVAGAMVQTFAQASQDRSILNNMDAIIGEVERVTGKWMEAFLLNEKRSGPNPRLLLALREGISSKAEPQIVCFPGSGLRVNKHHIYQITSGEK